MPHRRTVRPILPTALGAAFLGAALAVTAPAAASSNGVPGPPLDTHGGGPDGRTLVTSFTETNHDTGAVVAATHVDEYSSQGQLIRASETDTEDGAVTYSDVTALDYGQANRLARTVRVLDTDGAGPTPPATIVGTYHYDTRGNLVSLTTTTDEDSDGTVDETDTDLTTFDRRGRVVQERDEVGGHVLVFTVTLDAQGNLVALDVTDDDLSTPQSPDVHQVSTATFGPHHRQTSTTDKTYAVDAQGVEHLIAASFATIGYSSRGDLTRFRVESDNDGDGTIDDVRTVESTLDAQGRLLTTLNTEVFDGSTFVGRTTYTYDRQGNAVVFTAEDRLDGVLTGAFVEHDSYDQKGRLTAFVSEYDLDGDGVVDQIESVSITYDRLDRVVSDSTRVTDGEGNLLSTRVRTVVYGPDTATSTIQYDDDGDGTIDSTAVNVFPL